MDLNEISMHADQAKRLAVEYREALKERRDEEDLQLARAYEAIAKGHQVINVEEAMATAGFDEQGHPKLALAHPNARSVRAHMMLDAVCFFWNWDRRHWRAEPKRSGKEQQRVAFPGAQPIQYGRTLQTIAPNVPPAFRPGRYLQSDRLLWEVDQWVLTAPEDPALLKHLGGPLYTVVAVWDLTEVERLVLGHTRAQVQ